MFEDDLLLFSKIESITADCVILQEGLDALEVFWFNSTGFNFNAGKCKILCVSLEV